MTAPGFLENVRKNAAYLEEQLEGFASSYADIVEEVRGRGMIQAVVFRRDMPDLAIKMLKAGVLVLVGHGRIMRMLPPLVAGRDETDIFMEKLQEAVR
jgi:acetylornithine/succinyldiaminopimelate/putrescine aminotransferase